METKKLNYGYLGNGISFWENGDSEYSGHISENRKITINKSKTFTEENLRKIKEFARSENMIIGNKGNMLALSPINPVTKQHVNKVTGEIYQLSVETIDGRQAVCYGKQIFSFKPSDYEGINIDDTFKPTNMGKKNMESNQ